MFVCTGVKMKRKVFPVNQIWLIAGQPRQTEKPQQEETPLEEWGMDVLSWVPSKLLSGQLWGSLVFAIVREAFHLQIGWAVDRGRWQGEEGRVVKGRSREVGMRQDLSRRPKCTSHSFP